MAKRNRPHLRRNSAGRPRRPDVPPEEPHQAALTDREVEERREKEEARAAELARAN